MDERRARGRAARAESPRRRHADWEPAAGRRDPVDVLEEQAATRVPELVPIRYGRMLTSPFAFYRGAAALMAADLADTPTSGVRVQLCGDAHLSNFGFFASPERSLVFSVNDFDETLPGPWEWDVKRFAASFAIAARSRGASDAERRALLLRTVAAYRRAMREFAAMRDLEVWYARADVGLIERRLSAQAAKSEAKAFEKNVAKARAKDSMRALDRLTHRVDGQLRILADPPLIVPIEDLVQGRGRQEIEAGIARDHRRLPPHAPARPAAAAGRLPLRPPGPQGGGRGQRGHARLDRAPPGARRRRTRWCSRSRRPSPRCSSPTPGAASTPTRASAWWRGSA